MQWKSSSQTALYMAWNTLQRKVETTGPKGKMNLLLVFVCLFVWIILFLNVTDEVCTATATATASSTDRCWRIAMSTTMKLFTFSLMTTFPFHSLAYPKQLSPSPVSPPVTLAGKWRRWPIQRYQTRLETCALWSMLELRRRSLRRITDADGRQRENKNNNGL
jgi:hypothetical protein